MLPIASAVTCRAGRLPALCLMMFAAIAFTRAGAAAFGMQDDAAGPVSAGDAAPGPASAGERHAAGAAPDAAGVPEGEAASDDRSRSTMLRMLTEGSPFGLVIVGLIVMLSLVSCFLIIEHSLTITRARLMPDAVMAELERLVARGEINSAIEYCHKKEHYSLATELVLAGLERFRSSEFGFAEYRSAVEETGQDQTGRLYRKTEGLHVIAAIAPMLGLLGTVTGMIEAFNTIAARQGMARPEELGGAIGEALITTFLGLVVAIPTMVALSFFRNKIDSLVSEAGKRIERLMLPLGRKRKA